MCRNQRWAFLALSFLCFPLVCAAAPDTGRVPVPADWSQRIRETLLLVQKCNQSGDYAGLYNQLTPELRQKTTPAQIGQALAGFRQNKIDLTPVGRLTPNFAKDSGKDSRGFVHLAGSFPTQPLPVRFMIDYSLSGRSWQISNFNLDTTRPVKTARPPAEKHSQLNSSKPEARPNPSASSGSPVQASSQTRTAFHQSTELPNSIGISERLEPTPTPTPTANPHHRHVPPTTTNW